MNYSETANLRNSWERSGWGSELSQKSRFELAGKLIQEYGCKTEVLIDFGCNDGAFHEFLITKKVFSGLYIGFSVAKQMS